ncbi:MAG TPA: OmpA family protein [Sphingomonas sp.]
MLQAHKGDAGAVSSSVRAAFGAPAPTLREEIAAALFQPGEAILQPAARARFLTVGRAAAGEGASVRVESIGSDPAARRFDGWELAAARAASLARAIQEGGLDARRIDLAIDGTRAMQGQGQIEGQRLRVIVQPR